MRSVRRLYYVAPPQAPRRNWAIRGPGKRAASNPGTAPDLLGTANVSLMFVTETFVLMRD